MSALDIRDAKISLTWWLREWGVTDKPELKAQRFIDDMVSRGWQMDAKREQRPLPPTKADECPRHPGQHENWCGLCRVDTWVPTEHPPSPDLPPVADVNPTLAARLAKLAPTEERA